jgi:hypothetical protein
MKKLVLGSIVLTTFAIAVSIFQLSCQKSASAQTSTYALPPATTSSLGGIIVGSGLNVTSNGTLSVVAGTGTAQLNKIAYSKEISSGNFEFWTANYDGSNQTKINFTLPTGVSFSQNCTPHLSPDGKKIFFTAGPTNSVKYGEGDIYSLNIDGSGLTKVVSAGGLNPFINIGGVY